MKFFAYAAAALPVVSAATLPAAEIDLKALTCNVTTDFLSLDLPGKQVDVLGVLSNLLQAGEIDVAAPTTISRRSDVPFLHCGYARATRCALSSGGVLATCFWAAISGGRDIKEDSKCIAAAGAFGANLPNDCRLCLGM